MNRIKVRVPSQHLYEVYHAFQEECPGSFARYFNNSRESFLLINRADEERFKRWIRTYLEENDEEEVSITTCEFGSKRTPELVVEMIRMQIKPEDFPNKASLDQTIN